MAWFITRLLSIFLLPPLSFLVILLIGIFLLNRRPKLARFLLTTGLLLFWLTTTPYFSESGLQWLESQTTPLSDLPPEADAIVILGGGSYFNAPEYNYQDIASTGTLARLLYGAKLYRATHKPILVTGGTPQGNAVPESEQMRVILQHDFQVPVAWTEGASDNTFENAAYTAEILHQAGIHKIYLVTHAWHIPRAARAFRHAGFDVIEAPTGFTTRYKTDLLTFLPDAGAISTSSALVHEIIGLAWYDFRTRFGF